MEIYFNELSSGDAAMRLIDHFDKVNNFFSLIADLKSKFNINLVIINHRFNGLRLCDTLIADCFYASDFGFDQRNLLQQLRNYFKDESEVDKNFIFLHSLTNRSSILLGNAHEYSRPAISFTFHEHFATPELSGRKDNREVKVYNLYDRAQEYHPCYFVSKQDCKPYDPTVSPFWNTAATKKYHKSIEERLESIKTFPERKISILAECAKIIAELNGWELDEGLTKLNKNNSAYRRIYHSAKFCQGKGFLSVDFEKPELYFELYDKHGRHLGEYRWDGKLHKEADSKKAHDIKVR